MRYLISYSNLIAPDASLGAAMYFSKNGKYIFVSSVHALRVYQVINGTPALIFTSNEILSGGGGGTYQLMSVNIAETLCIVSKGNLSSGIWGYDISNPNSPKLILDKNFATFPSSINIDNNNGVIHVIVKQAGPSVNYYSLDINTFLTLSSKALTGVPVYTGSPGQALIKNNNLFLSSNKIYKYSLPAVNLVNSYTPAGNPSSGIIIATDNNIINFYNYASSIYIDVLDLNLNPIAQYVYNNPPVKFLSTQSINGAFQIGKNNYILLGCGPTGGYLVFDFTNGAILEINAIPNLAFVQQSNGVFAGISAGAQNIYILKLYNPANVNSGLTSSQTGGITLINMHRPVSLLGNYKS